MNNITKPTLVVREEFTEQLVGLVNNSGLPLVLIEPIIDGLASNIKQTIANQLIQEKEKYAEDLAKAKEEEKVAKTAPKTKTASKAKSA